MVCNANLDRLGADADETVEQKGSYVVAYDHPGCHRTSNAVDRPMNRLCRLRMQAGACTAIKARPSYGCGAGPCC